jgi:thymidylate synthase (FAD)
VEKNMTRLTKFNCTQTKFGTFPTEDTPLASIDVHDYGHVGLLATYGSDEMIAQTARVSYGIGTKKTRTDVSLLRYLVRHRHTSPLEHAEVVFYLKIPIFVARQLLRHRTANVNEYSARYSELSNEFYVPKATYLAPQSTINRQGREGSYTSDEQELIRDSIMHAQETGHHAYRSLLTTHNLSRELARIATSVGTYTEMYWKCDLHNFLHFLKLRMDEHAQQEIRDIATAMFECAAPFFPITIDAWKDYVLNSQTLSAMEVQMLSTFMKHYLPADAPYPSNLFPRMSDREHREFQLFLNKLRA